MRCFFLPRMKGFYVVGNSFFVFFSIFVFYDFGGLGAVFSHRDYEHRVRGDRPHILVVGELRGMSFKPFYDDFDGCWLIFHEYLMILIIFLKTDGFRKTRFFDRSRSSRAHWRVARQKTISKMVSRARDVGETPSFFGFEGFWLDKTLFGGR